MTLTDWLHAPDYWLSRLVITRGLGVIYVIAFLVALNQFRPLLGERGLLPVPAFVSRRTWRDSPSLFHCRYSDRLASVTAWIGIVVAAALLAGLPQQGPLWLPMLAWLV